MPEDAPNLHEAEHLFLYEAGLTHGINHAKWAFYAGCAASWTTGLLTGMLLCALAWSHMGG